MIVLITGKISHNHIDTRIYHTPVYLVDDVPLEYKEYKTHCIPCESCITSGHVHYSRTIPHAPCSHLEPSH